MGALIHFDVASVMVLSIILFTTFYRKMNKGTANRIFILMILTALTAGAFEILQILLYAFASPSDAVHTIVKSLYLLAHSFATPVYCMYIISLARTWHQLKVHPIISVALVLPYTVVFFGIIVNIFTGWMFRYENGEYIRNEISFFFIYISAAVYILFSVIYIIANRILFKRHQILALASMMPLSVLAVVVKVFYPNSLVEIFSNAIGIMIMSMVIQRPEEFIDSFTRLRKYTAYADDMKKSYITNNNVTVILINIANYSSVSHILGYDGTNRMLDSIARQLEKVDRELKSFAEIYYLDKGRFRFVLNSFNSKKARRAANDINEILKETISISKVDISLNAYVCVARCPEDLDDFQSLISFGSDFHKKLPNSGDVIYAEEILKQRDFSLINEMDDIIDRAFENGNFRVYYQPIYSVQEKRFTSAEALLRLIDDVHGFVPPDIFIPVAERSGAIHKIGSFVLNDVCRFIASDKFKGLGLDYVEINLSVAQCMQGDLADEVLETLDKFKVFPSQINLEITETAASHDQSIMTENLTRLSEAGISFSLDDFGTGYSNMDRVASLPLKIVKLDRSFVNSQHKPKMGIFLENFIRMFKDMEMEIVVEGIETEQMVRRFSDLHCDFIQGYYYSKPIPEDEFVKFIQNSKIA